VRGAASKLLCLRRDEKGLAMSRSGRQTPARRGIPAVRTK